MKRFLLKSLLFVCILFVLLMFIEYLLRSTAFGHDYNKKYLDNNANNIQILALGNSLIWSGLNPEFFEYNSFNAANNGQNYYLSQEILNKYFDNFDNLEMVITQIDYEYLIIPPKSHYLYTINYGFKSEKISDFFIFSNFPLQNAIIRIIDYYFLDKRFRHGEQQPLGNHLSTKTANIDELKRDYRHDNLFRISDDDLNNISINTEIILDMAQKLATKNIKLLLITTPTHPIRRDWMNKEYVNIIHDVANYVTSMATNIEYLDFLYDYDFNELDFSDAYHINASGAEKMSKKIAQYLTF